MNGLQTTLMRLLSLCILTLFAQNTVASATLKQNIAEQLAQIVIDGEFDNSQFTSRFEFGDENNNLPSPFILGGTNTGRDVYREYTLVILTDGAGNISGLCGGTVIASNKVLTAAHCAQGRASSYFVIPNFYSFNDRIRATDLIRVSRVVDHPSYSPQSLDFDVAIMTLRSTTSTPPARVVSGSDLFAGKQGLVIGTGLSATSPSPRAPDILQEVAAPIISNTQCGRNFSQLAGSNPITSNMICAGFSNKANGTCSGDSGGPLFVNIKGRRAIAGVVSFGFRTCEANRATNGYARMTAFTDFIRSQSPSTQFVAANGAGALAGMYMLLLGDNEGTLELPPPSDPFPPIAEFNEGKYKIALKSDHGNFIGRGE